MSLNLHDYTSGFRFIKLRDSSNKYSIYMDKFNFGSGSETFVMVEYEKAASLSAMTNGQFFKIADAGSGQPLDFDVRFVKSDKAKLAYFMPPPQLSLADGATVQIDGVNIVSRSGNNVTFDNSTVSSVWDFKNAQSVTAAIQIQNNNFYDYDISTSAGKNYKVMLNVDGSGYQSRVL